MKLKIRTLHNDEVEIEVDTTDTILCVKGKVEAKLPSMESDKQKLIHAGKILANDQKVSDYPAIKDNDKLVVMVTKTSTAKPPVATASSSASSSTVSHSSSTGDSTSATSSSTSPSSSSSPSTSSSTDSTDSSPPTISTNGAVTTTTTSGAPSTAAASTSSASSDGSSAVSSSTASSSLASTAVATDSTSGGSSSEAVGYESAASALLTGSRLEDTMANIRAMGFARADVQAAMRAAFNNPDRAVEYLMSGIPDHLQSELAPPPPTTASAAAAAPTVGGGGGGATAAPAAPAGTTAGATAAAQRTALAGGGGAMNPLMALRQHPQFASIREMLQTNPAMLPQVLEIIGQSNPQLLQIINENPNAFMDILRDPASAGGGGGGGDGGGTLISVTSAEMEAIQRLQGLGFSRGAVEEAFLACDRNEEMAANYLFENANDIMGDDGVDMGEAGDEEGAGT